MWAVTWREESSMGQRGARRVRWQGTVGVGGSLRPWGGQQG